MSTPNTSTVDTLLAQGLKNLWYPICRSDMLGDAPLSIRRLGVKLVVWRSKDAQEGVQEVVQGQGKVHALEDHCPHRGAPLSQGVILGDRLACPYHGVEVRCDGRVTKVPASPGSPLEGARATQAFHAIEAHEAIWIYNAAGYVDTPPPLVLPEQLTDGEQFSSFLCYAEWGADYRYALDNLMDPMHGTFLHKLSHSMADGDISAKFVTRQTPTGFVFEKDGQRDVNFDWTEWADTGVHWMRLEIPYPKTGGPGGSFAIIACVTPISATQCAAFFWRCRRVQGWQRDTWRFLYRNRLEARHWTVLEQDRVMMEAMEPDANQREKLYAHDAGLVRLRRHLLGLAQKELAKSI